MNRTRLALAALATTSLVAISAPAWAQAVAGSPAAAPPSEPQTVGEVVVTATRREARLQDVPLAVSAVAGNKLVAAGFQNIQDVQYAVPGVQFGDTPNDAGFRLRGVGSAGGFTSASEQNVALVIDGVVIPFGNPIESLGDIDRIEVLKGPQGTQFGKNASSGVISITTRRPRLGEFSGSAFASYGSFAQHDVHGEVNIPLGKTAAMDLYLFHKGNDGFIHNSVLNTDWGDRQSEGGRAKVLWKPTDQLDVLVSGDYSRTKTNSPGQLWTLNKAPVGDPAFSLPFVNLAALGVTPGINNDVSVENTPGQTHDKNYGVSAEANYHLDGYTLTSLTAYRAERTGPLFYAIDASPLSRFTARERGTDYNFLSQELRITSPSGGLVEYVAGVYLSRNDVRNQGASAQLRPALPFDPLTISITNGFNESRTVTKSAAAFADGSLRLTDTLKLLGGIRVTNDAVRAWNGSTFDPNSGATVPYAPRPVQEGEVSKTDWSGRIGLEYKPTSDLMFYGTLARGYLGPTITFSGLTGTKSSVAPQTVRDITVGAKTQFFDRRLTLNGDIFWDKYKNLQTAVFNGFEFLTQNAGGFEAKGVEIDGSFQATRNLSFNGGVTYSDAQFTDYVTSCPTPITVAGGAELAAVCNAPGSTSSTPLYQAAGQPLPGAPRYTANFGVSYQHPIASSLRFDGSVNAYYRSSTQNSVGDPGTRMGGYTTVNLNTGIGAEDGKWRIAVFARNLFDKRFQSAILGLPFTSGVGYLNWETLEGRRTVGVSLESKF